MHALPLLLVLPFGIAYAMGIAGTIGRARIAVTVIGALPVLVLLYLALIVATSDGR